MINEEYWNAKWEQAERVSVSNYAKRCYAQMAGSNYQTLLDVGCGNGKDSLYFAQKGIHVTSVDFSGAAIEQLKQMIAGKGLSNISAIKKDITDLNIDDNSFDVVYAHLSLQYFDDEVTTKVFDRLYRILKPGGMIFIRCKSTDDRLYGQGEKIRDDMFIKGHTRHFFSKQYLSVKLAKFCLKRIRRTSSVYHGYKSSFVEAVAIKHLAAN